MARERHNCSWCGSANSVEYGVCQICLMEFRNEATVIALPLDRIGDPKRIVKIDDRKRAGIGE